MSNHKDADTADEIILTLILYNAVDMMLGERGHLSAEEVRMCTTDVVVKPKTSHFCLPIDLIETLGLTKVGQWDMRTAEGVRKANIYEGLGFDIDSREGQFRCVELPTGSRPILGWIPLANLSLEVDWENNCLRHVPLYV